MKFVYKCLSFIIIIIFFFNFTDDKTFAGISRKNCDRIIKCHQHKNTKNFNIHLKKINQLKKNVQYSRYYCVKQKINNLKNFNKI